jgi:hypothetical protein
MNQIENDLPIEKTDSISGYKETLLTSPLYFKNSISNNSSNWNAVHELNSKVEIFNNDPLGYQDISTGSNYRDIHELYIKTDLKLGGEGLNYLNSDNPTLLTEELIQTINNGGHITGPNTIPDAYSIHHINGRNEPFVSDPNYLILVTNEEHAAINNNTSDTIYEKQDYDEIIKDNLRKANSSAFWDGIWTSIWMGFVVGFISEMIFVALNLIKYKEKLDSKSVEKVFEKSFESGFMYVMIAIPIYLFNALILSVLFRIFGFFLSPNGVVVITAIINISIFISIKVYYLKKNSDKKVDNETIVATVIGTILFMFIIILAFNWIGLIGSSVLLALHRYFKDESKIQITEI